MLVVTRKGGEGIRVGDILISFVQVAGGRVRVGIDAPRDVPILRTELEDRRATPRGPDKPQRAA